MSLPKGSDVSGLPDGAASGSEPTLVATLPSPPPPLGELPVHLHRLHDNPAPRFYWEERGGWRRLIKRAINFVQRFVGAPQATFNREVVEGLTMLMAEVRGLRRWAETIAGTPADRPLDPVLQDLATLRERLAHLQQWMSAELSEASRQRRERVDQLDAAVVQLERRIEALGTQDVSLLREFREGFSGHAAWITTLQRKYQGVSLEAREHAEPTAAVREPQVVDPDAYARRLSEMNGTIRVNVGCGEHPVPGYVNVDLRALPGIDVLADARRLPFEPGTLDEIASSHLVEHFREHQARTRVVPYWKSLLRSDGRLRIVCPNWAAMLERVQDGRMRLEEFKLVTFGWQDYEGDDHFAMYTPETLRALLADVGFGRIDMLAIDRMNGLCPEMELVAHLSDTPQS
jgi:predicted SAM-dependent methyltransferase